MLGRSILFHIRVGLQTFLFGVYGVRNTFRREFLPELFNSVASTGINVAIYGFMSFVIGFRAPDYFQYFLVSFILSNIGDVGRIVVSSMMAYGRALTSWIRPTKIGNGFLYIFYILNYGYKAAISIGTALIVAYCFNVSIPMPYSALPMILAALLAYASFGALMQAITERLGVRSMGRKVFFTWMYYTFNSFIAGVYFPVKLFPEPIRSIASIYPLTIALSEARKAFFTGISNLMLVGNYLAWALASLVLTALVIKWIWKIIIKNALWEYYAGYV